MNTKVIRFIVWLAFLLIIDQLLKQWIKANLNIGQSITVIRDMFEITHVENTGVAFGMLSGKGAWLAPIAIIVAGFAGYTYVNHKENDKWFGAGMVLLAAGAIGNFIDRIFNNGKVVDFIDVKFIHVFNVADMCITAAVIILLGKWAFESRKQDPNVNGS